MLTEEELEQILYKNLGIFIYGEHFEEGRLNNNENISGLSESSSTGADN